MATPSTARYTSFAEFYPYYLQEHRNDTCRRLHYVGSLLVLGIIAWVGHFVFEKNRPATFQYPLYSLMGDWVMLKDALTGRIRF